MIDLLLEDYWNCLSGKIEIDFNVVCSPWCAFSQTLFPVHVVVLSDGRQGCCARRAG